MASGGRKSRLSAAIVSSIQPYSTASYRQKCWWASTRIMTPTRTNKCNHEDTKCKKNTKKTTPQRRGATEKTIGTLSAGLRSACACDLRPAGAKRAAQSARKCSAGAAKRRHGQDRTRHEPEQRSPVRVSSDPGRARRPALQAVP